MMAKIVSADVIADYLVKKTGISINVVRSSKNNERTKFSRYYLCKKLRECGLSHARIGEYINSTSSGVSFYIHKYDELLRTDRNFINFLNKLGDLGAFYVVCDRDLDVMIEHLSVYMPKEKAVEIVNKIRV